MSQGHLDNPEIQRQLKEAEKTRRMQERSDLESVLKTAAGRRYFYRVVFDPELGGLECGSLDHHVKDGHAAALHLAHSDGARALARALVNEAQEVCPRLYLQMITERIAAQIADDEARQTTEQSAGDKPS